MPQRSPVLFKHNCVSPHEQREGNGIKSDHQRVYFGKESRIGTEVSVTALDTTFPQTAMLKPPCFLDPLFISPQCVSASTANGLPQLHESTTLHINTHTHKRAHTHAPTSNSLAGHIPETTPTHQSVNEPQLSAVAIERPITSLPQSGITNPTLMNLMKVQ